MSAECHDANNKGWWILLLIKSVIRAIRNPRQQPQDYRQERGLSTGLSLSSPLLGAELNLGWIKSSFFIVQGRKHFPGGITVCESLQESYFLGVCSSLASGVKGAESAKKSTSNHCARKRPNKSYITWPQQVAQERQRGLVVTRTTGARGRLEDKRGKGCLGKSREQRSTKKCGSWSKNWA